MEAYNNAYNNTEVDVAQTLFGLSNMTNLPPPHGKHEVLQMLDCTLNAETTRGKCNTDSNVGIPPIHKQKKRKREDEAVISEIRQHPNELTNHQQCTQAIQQNDRHRQGQITLKIRAGN